MKYIHLFLLAYCAIHISCPYAMEKTVGPSRQKTRPSITISQPLHPYAKSLTLFHTHDSFEKAGASIAALMQKNKKWNIILTNPKKSGHLITYLHSHTKYNRGQIAFYIATPGTNQWFQKKYTPTDDEYKCVAAIFLSRVYAQDYQAVKRCLSMGIDVNTTSLVYQNGNEGLVLNHFEPALITATWLLDSRMVQFLLRHNADCNIVDLNGNTALSLLLQSMSYADQSSEKYTMRQLLELFASQTLISGLIKNSQGLTTIDYAQEYGFDELASLLQSKAINEPYMLN